MTDSGHCYKENNDNALSTLSNVVHYKYDTKITCIVVWN